ncbi:DUF4258 domain-containing protein [Candidatus Sumerlaeota bacterium]|nr:DUF4258 domain-containing protein [Candidatus Sumerlaeota bacterium]
MSKAFDIESLRAAVESRRVHWQQHALERLLERGINRDEVLRTLSKGEVIAIYSEDRPYPSCLILRVETEPLHVVASVDSEAGICHVITCYRPDLGRFEPDFKTRRTRS